MTDLDDLTLDRRLREACSATIPCLLDDAWSVADGDGPRDDSPFGPESDVGDLVLGAEPTRGQRSRWPVTIAAAALVAVGVGVLAVRDRGDDPATASIPPASEPVTATGAMPPTGAPVSLGTDELCGAAGCDNFDALPLVPGAATFYRSDLGTEFGPEVTDLDRFTHLTRCAELTSDGTACARIEGIAGVGIVTYGESSDSPSVEIGTTFTTITPAQYAAHWGPTQGGGDTSTLVVRGHHAVRYANELRDAVVWQEAPGVLVWIAVDPALGDDLLDIAEDVRPADPAEVPSTIPHRVVVAGLGDAYDAKDNDGDGVIVGVHDGLECVGFGFIDHCGTELEDRVIVRTAGDAIRVSGSAPPEVVKVRVTTSPDVGAQAETVAFAPYESRFFSVFVGAGDSLTVEWLNAADQVVDSAVLTQLVTSIDAGIGPDPTVGNTVPDVDGLVVAIVDATGTSGAADAIAADLAARGYVVASVLPSTRTFEQSMFMPVNPPSDRSRELLAVLGIGGFDTWTPDVVDTPLADTVTDVIVIGTDGLSAMTPPDAANSTTTTVR